MEDVLFAESLFNIDKESMPNKGFKIFSRFTKNSTKANKMNIIVAANAKEAAKLIRTRGIDAAKDKVNDLLNKSFDYCKDMIDSAVFGIWADGGLASDHRITAALLTMCYLLVVVVFLSYLTILLFGNSIIYTILSAVVFAPIFEEAAKQVSIRGGFAREFFSIFNMYEFSEYVLALFPAYGIAIIPVRLAAVGLHLTTTIVQWTVGHNRDLFNDPTIREEDRVKKARNLGYILGVLIHTLWNGTAIMLGR